MMRIYDASALAEINSDNVTESYSLPGIVDFFYTRPQLRGGGIALFGNRRWEAVAFFVSIASAECLALKVSDVRSSRCRLAFSRPKCESVCRF